MSAAAAKFHESSISAAVQTQTGWGRILEFFAAWCQPQPGWQVLDVGCGPGLLPALFSHAGCQAAGVDLDYDSFSPPRLHTVLAQAEAQRLPFPNRTFHLVTASNLLFLLLDPLPALVEMARVACCGGQIALINPSEQMTLSVAAVLADQHQLNGVARASLLEYAARAEANQRWNKQETEAIFDSAGIHLDETTLRMGPGLVRFSRGTLL